jgi:hypothetical protein
LGRAQSGACRRQFGRTAFFIAWMPFGDIRINVNARWHDAGAVNSPSFLLLIDCLNETQLCAYTRCPSFRLIHLFV